MMKVAGSRSGKVSDSTYSSESDGDSSSESEDNESDDFEDPGLSCRCKHCGQKFSNYRLLSEHQQKELQKLSNQRKRKSEVVGESSAKRKRVRSNAEREGSNKNETANKSSLNKGMAENNRQRQLSSTQKENATVYVSSSASENERNGEDRRTSVTDTPGLNSVTVNAHLKLITDYLKEYPAKIKPLLDLLSLKPERRVIMKVYRCLQCSIHIIKKKEFRNHLKKHNDKKFRCDHCKLDFTMKSLRKHLKVHERDGVTAEDFEFIEESDAEGDGNENTSSLNNSASRSREKEAYNANSNDRANSSNENRKENPSHSKSSNKSASNTIDTSQKQLIAKSHESKRHKSKLTEDNRKQTKNSGQKLHKTNAAKNITDARKSVDEQRQNQTEPASSPTQAKQSQKQIPQPNPMQNNIKTPVKKKINLYRCDFCGLHYLKKADHPKLTSLREHIDLGNNGIVCSICQIKFSGSAMARHEFEHHWKKNANSSADYHVILYKSSAAISGAVTSASVTGTGPSAAVTFPPVAEIGCISTSVTATSARVSFAPLSGTITCPPVTFPPITRAVTSSSTAVTAPISAPVAFVPHPTVNINRVIFSRPEEVKKTITPITFANHINHKPVTGMVTSTAVTATLPSAPVNFAPITRPTVNINRIPLDRPEVNRPVAATRVRLHKSTENQWTVVSKEPDKNTSNSKENAAHNASASLRRNSIEVNRPARDNVTNMNKGVENTKHLNRKETPINSPERSTHVESFESEKNTRNTVENSTKPITIPASTKNSPIPTTRNEDKSRRVTVLDRLLLEQGTTLESPGSNDCNFRNRKDNCSALKDNPSSVITHTSNIVEKVVISNVKPASSNADNPENTRINSEITTQCTDNSNENSNVTLPIAISENGSTYDIRQETVNVTATIQAEATTAARISLEITNAIEDRNNAPTQHNVEGIDTSVEEVVQSRFFCTPSSNDNQNLIEKADKDNLQTVGGTDTRLNDCDQNEVIVSERNKMELNSTAFNSSNPAINTNNIQDNNSFEQNERTIKANISTENEAMNFEDNSFKTEAPQIVGVIGNAKFADAEHEVLENIEEETEYSKEIKAERIENMALESKENIKDDLERLDDIKNENSGTETQNNDVESENKEIIDIVTLSTDFETTIEQKSDVMIPKYDADEKIYVKDEEGVKMEEGPEETVDIKNSSLKSEMSLTEDIIKAMEVELADIKEEMSIKEEERSDSQNTLRLVSDDEDMDKVGSVVTKAKPNTPFDSAIPKTELADDNIDGAVGSITTEFDKINALPDPKVVEIPSNTKTEENSVTQRPEKDDTETLETRENLTTPDVTNTLPVSNRDEVLHGEKEIDASEISNQNVNVRKSPEFEYEDSFDQEHLTSAISNLTKHLDDISGTSEESSVVKESFVREINEARISDTNQNDILTDICETAINENNPEQAGNVSNAPVDEIGVSNLDTLDGNSQDTVLYGDTQEALSITENIEQVQKDSEIRENDILTYASLAESEKSPLTCDHQDDAYGNNTENSTNNDSVKDDKEQTEIAESIEESSKKTVQLINPFKNKVTEVDINEIIVEIERKNVPSGIIEEAKEEGGASLDINGTHPLHCHEVIHKTKSNEHETKIKDNPVECLEIDLKNIKQEPFIKDMSDIQAMDPTTAVIEIDIDDDEMDEEIEHEKEDEERQDEEMLVSEPGETAISNVEKSLEDTNLNDDDMNVDNSETTKKVNDSLDQELPNYVESCVSSTTKVIDGEGTDEEKTRTETGLQESDFTENFSAQLLNVDTNLGGIESDHDNRVTKVETTNIDKTDHNEFEDKVIVEEKQIEDLVQNPNQIIGVLDNEMADLDDKVNEEMILSVEQAGMVDESKDANYEKENITIPKENIEVHTNVELIDVNSERDKEGLKEQENSPKAIETSQNVDNHNEDSTNFEASISETYKSNDDSVEQEKCYKFVLVTKSSDNLNIQTNEVNQTNNAENQKLTDGDKSEEKPHDNAFNEVSALNRTKNLLKNEIKPAKSNLETDNSQILSTDECEVTSTNDIQELIEIDAISVSESDSDIEITASDIKQEPIDLDDENDDVIFVSKRTQLDGEVVCISDDESL